MNRGGAAAPRRGYSVEDELRTRRFGRRPGAPPRRRYAALVFYTGGALLSVATRNPGLFARCDACPVKDDGRPAVGWVWNDQARTYKPPGARYCCWANAVFYDFDHTCPWTGTAIARDNMTSFRHFVASVNVLSYATAAVFVIGVVGFAPRD